MNPTPLERFQGCLLGLAVGDSLGAHFEGLTAGSIARRYSNPEKLLSDLPPGKWWYSDDTEMAIGVAETLLERGEIDFDVLCRRFADNYRPSRGYGRGTRTILEAILAGRDHRWLAKNSFPGGSLGNGAAMRVAPVGLAFCDDLPRVREQAMRSALPTHLHPLGIEGAELIAVAVALALRGQAQGESFVAQLTTPTSAIEYSGPLGRAAGVRDRRDLALFGNGVAAPDSVVTAIATFLLTPDNYADVIANAILLGGDTDTIAAMAGAISGAYLGIQAIPPHFVDALEDFELGRTYLMGLATKLYEKFGREVDSLRAK